ncbi:MAG: hypothetical protein A2268_05015 [Candidatus Raymondbacteria bacterium RifOxyA12_full_50_37]|uniref:Uroporphyrinogen decarboxylase n=1 Tax=Candidatus Raymondbacteria bacterium RIFOXYD12_FULL_49_13 TaxID=1817890 RepID=A0A1F7FD86_UNCRA|nr:MAG: hypothetical protein A2268_05015 [Candidatus Raymondbacteria bacterium RifOxyA12_full_50_37]OGJ94104.1 MAG: hypothetical protein A2248_12220 [Candidatus Raymondbacteria bacterium RIFOXYA2_FULL_49_16]OGJ96929.1 MAG: hypothetical protein A2453_04820 [Candidatus Raymondbacteria bacterium RIFOXYC2_FULL_50_21]OGJ99499.1 MAG: hypothetical protein A2350_10675 [Candidatus Raymondbacteria bacterium RifOxyB12_full_50_8]OGK04655.1 MAG: hypothetical protein A2519_20985 [Candidatus Raymondbacteria b
MTGRERVRNALQLKEVDRVPWVPFVGCHGGYLINVPAEEYLKSENHILAGIDEAVKRYAPDGLPVMFDLQVEAEVLGCNLVWAKENPPAVSTHPLAEGHSLTDLCIPGPDEGRIRTALAAVRRAREKYPDLALYGLVTGPFTLAMHLAGTDIFMKMFDDRDSVRTLLAFCRDVSCAMAGYYIQAGCDVVGVVDPMTSQIGPDEFRQFVTQPATAVFDHIRNQSAFGSFFVCGHAEQNIEAMCECRPDNISIDENIPLDYVRDICLARNISFGGNLQLTVVLLLGSAEDAMRNAIGCLETGGTKGFILAPGCDLPFATPPANLEAVTRIVQDPYQREVVNAMAHKQTAEKILDMSQYGQADKVVVDIITLDSESCAPCQYMVEAVRSVTPEFEGIVEWREHKIKQKESIVFMTALMVRNIPTICIDGQITFVSRIPPREELVAAIQRRINEKLKKKIQAKQSVMYVLGTGCEACETVKKHAVQAIKELGANIVIKVIKDEDEIRSFGVSKTPGVVIERRQIKSAGAIPSVEVIKEWVKEL